MIVSVDAKIFEKKLSLVNHKNSLKMGIKEITLTLYRPYMTSPQLVSLNSENMSSSKTRKKPLPQLVFSIVVEVIVLARVLDKKKN